MNEISKYWHIQCFQKWTIGEVTCNLPYDPCEMTNVIILNKMNNSYYGVYSIILLYRLHKRITRQKLNLHETNARKKELFERYRKKITNNILIQN